MAKLFIFAKEEKSMCIGRGVIAQQNYSPI